MSRADVQAEKSTGIERTRDEDNTTIVANRFVTTSVDQSVTVRYFIYNAPRSQNDVVKQLLTLDSPLFLLLVVAEKGSIQIRGQFVGSVCLC
jgi:hypothetical protein